MALLSFVLSETAQFQGKHSANRFRSDSDANEDLTCHHPRRMRDAAHLRGDPRPSILVIYDVFHGCSEVLLFLQATRGYQAPQSLAMRSSIMNFCKRPNLGPYSLVQMPLFGCWGIATDQNGKGKNPWLTKQSAVAPGARSLRDRFFKQTQQLEALAPSPPST